jgi:hypothetical protein
MKQEIKVEIPEWIRILQNMLKKNKSKKEKTK